MSTRTMSKRATIDKEKAMFTARNVKDSKFGEAILRNNLSENRQLSAEISRLKSELRRKNMHFEQERKRFLSSKMERPEPTLIVERPPSPEAIRKALYARYSDPYKTYTSEPGFMRPTRSKAKTPTFIPVIDAFSVKTRKKVNLWEGNGRALPRFQSSIMPSAPLCEEEVEALQRGWLFHQKPGHPLSVDTGPLSASTALVPLKTKKKKRRTKKKRVVASLALPEATPLVELTPTDLEWRADGNGRWSKSVGVTFITELPNEIRENEEENRAETLELDSRRVSFSSAPFLRKTSRESVTSSGRRVRRIAVHSMSPTALPGEESMTQDVSFREQKIVPTCESAQEVAIEELARENIPTAVYEEETKKTEDTKAKEGEKEEGEKDRREDDSKAEFCYELSADGNCPEQDNAQTDAEPQTVDGPLPTPPGKDPREYKQKANPELGSEDLGSDNKSGNLDNNCSDQGTVQTVAGPQIPVDLPSPPSQPLAKLNLSTSPTREPVGLQNSIEAQGREGVEAHGSPQDSPREELGDSDEKTQEDRVKLEPLRNGNRSSFLQLLVDSTD